MSRRIECFTRMLFALFVFFVKIQTINSRQSSPESVNTFVTTSSVESDARKSTPNSAELKSSSSNGESVSSFCAKQSDRECSRIDADCMSCEFNTTCVYGSPVTANCTLTHSGCKGLERGQIFVRTHLCAYCYQLPESQYDCVLSSNCRGNSRYLTNCTVHQNVLCLGKRVFPKYLTCNFISGYKWSTALILSITLGGFGVDRFYLGHWQEGIGKLFSFGGLGVWTLVDVILIATGYLKPADGSRYM